ncbi:protein arginine methyltransferase NDUFAF7, mitochondrial [Cynara cardunculus var. scolymus]|uniref:Protein arginine methyltransferase NDUFAF7 n=1 Tax=Cynara cardunculus var. scolymus TaxID=59895 RepID=A0A103XL38_CYNCS|nr:protein arginine methyltransferase NDUFAF7, mitochondrial [Cynara cardunculus var. scolymus]KVH92732.1 putative S-adenosyl-L-methionine-dependent methyltransferase MidA [Cynara cardunculus var. scolymus]
MLRRFIGQASVAQRCRHLSGRQELVDSVRRCSSSSAAGLTKVPLGTTVEQAVDAQYSDDYTSQPSAKISVDRSGLNNPPEHSHEPSTDSELVKHLKSIIKFRGGPISVAEYMEEVLINPKAGFYINRDVFGAEGDFITSPEVSQMFGEMVGVWAMCLWEQMGQPNRVNLVEFGPGRGTLMADLLRGAKKFEKFTEALHIHMIEVSPALKKIQKLTLKCNDDDGDENTVSALTGTRVSWHATLEEVPTGLPTIIIAHEFYDALPVHQFQKASRGWCEKMIDVAEDSKFHVVLSPQPTPATLYLLKRCKWARTEELSKLEHVEVCPKAMDLTQNIAKRISTDGGGALIIDYGLDGIVSDSLQAIRKHKFVNLLDDPGSADLSAYVDFPAIRHSAEEVSEDVSVYGPITQSQFLGNLGINFRVEALLQNCTEEQAESLRTGYWRLVGEGEAPFWEGPDELTPIGMGSRYLAMAIVNKKQGTPVPFQ